MSLTCECMIVPHSATRHCANKPVKAYLKESTNQVKWYCKECLLVTYKRIFDDQPADD